MISVKVKVIKTVHASRDAEIGFCHANPHAETAKRERSYAIDEDLVRDDGQRTRTGPS